MEPLRCSDLPSGPDLLTNDFGWNAGVGTSATELQTVLGFTGDDVDGWIGPAIIGAASQQVPATLINRLAAAHAAYYRSRPQFPTYGAGWLARVERGRLAALALVPAVGARGFEMQQGV